MNDVLVIATVTYRWIIKSLLTFNKKICSSRSRTVFGNLFVFMFQKSENELHKLGDHRKIKVYFCKRIEFAMSRDSRNHSLCYHWFENQI